MLSSLRQPPTVQATTKPKPSRLEKFGERTTAQKEDKKEKIEGKVHRQVFEAAIEA